MGGREAGYIGEAWVGSITLHLGRFISSNETTDRRRKTRSAGSWPAGTSGWKHIKHKEKYMFPKDEVRIGSKCLMSTSPICTTRHKYKRKPVIYKSIAFNICKVSSRSSEPKVSDLNPDLPSIGSYFIKVINSESLRVPPFLKQKY